MYEDLASRFGPRVSYSEAAARAIHPAMRFNTGLDGRECVVDYIHEAPYCVYVYARALVALADASRQR